MLRRISNQVADDAGAGVPLEPFVHADAVRVGEHRGADDLSSTHARAHINISGVIQTPKN